MCKAAGDHCPLPLAAAECPDPALGKVEQIRAGKRIDCQIKVAPLLNLEATEIGSPSHKDDVEYSVLKGNGAFLRHHRHLSGQLTASNRANVSPLKRY